MYIYTIKHVVVEYNDETEKICIVPQLASIIKIRQNTNGPHCTERKPCSYLVVWIR